MKNLYLLLLTLLCFSTAVSAKYQPDTLLRYENLYHTCKIWGFLKYYHPNITQKNIDWDHELFLIIDKIADAKSKNERNTILSEWIEALGHCPAGNPFIVSDFSSCSKFPDLQWISDKSILGEKVSNQLTCLYKKTKFKNKYIQFDAASRPDILEEPYLDFDRSNRKYYVLALFRYWNVIEYYFPYKHLIATSWDNVLKEQLPVFYNTTNEYDYFFNLYRLSTAIEDAHSSISTYGKSNAKELNELIIQKKLVGFHGAPVELEMINHKLFVVGFCNKSGYKELIPGDQILQFDNKNIMDMLAYKERYYARSNDSRGFIFESFLVSDKDSADIEYIRDDSLCRKKIKCEEYRWDNPTHKSNLYIRQDSTSYYTILDDNIGYIDPGKVKASDDTYSDYQKLKDCKGIVFDLRRYPHIWGFHYAALFVRSPYRNSLFSCPSQEVPGLFNYQNYLHASSMEFFNPAFYKGPVAVIVNNKTQSSGEMMALQLKGREHTKIIGNQTAGANGDLRYINLPGGFRASFSALGIYYPDKTGMQKTGVKIDEIVYPTLRGIKEGRDELLEKALEYINKFKTRTHQNLDFEETVKGIPNSWYWDASFDNNIKIDSTDRYKGKYSLSIESLQCTNDTTIIAVNPMRNEKNWKSLKVTAYIKAEQGINGAGICLNADPFSIQAENPRNNVQLLSPVWRKIEYSFENTGNFTNELYLSLYLIKKGKVWFDEITLEYTP